MLPVAFITILISVPKFLEMELGSYDGNYYVTVTDLRKHPDYSYYYMGVQVILKGMVPIILLAFFYFKVNRTFVYVLSIESIYCSLSEKQ